MEIEMNSFIRNQFPALKLKIKGIPVAYLDGPGGYQVPERVINAAANYLIGMDANVDGAFTSSRKTGEMIRDARQAFADFFNCSCEDVAFGANMTTLNFALAQALACEMIAGDRVLITEIDHEGNRAPWQALQGRGIIVEEIEVDTKTCTLDMNDFKKKLSPAPKVVAVNYASNALGTINDVKKIVELSQKMGAYTVVDAVHYAAHGTIDVKQLGTDFLLCSAYKFFGPHIGVLYAKKDVLNKLTTLRVRPQHDYAPYKIETGTLDHEGIAGAAEAVEFVAEVGEKFGKKFMPDKGEPIFNRRNKIVAGLKIFESYEKELTEYLVDELSKIEKVKIYGPPNGHPRTSTVSFTYNGYTPHEIAEYFDSKAIFVWDGDFYATRLIERLGLKDSGGLIRIGIAPYNTKEELKRLIEALQDERALESFVNTQKRRS